MARYRATAESRQFVEGAEFELDDMMAAIMAPMHCLELCEPAAVPMDLAVGDVHAPGTTRDERTET